VKRGGKEDGRETGKRVGERTMLQTREGDVKVKDKAKTEKRAYRN